MRTVRSGGSLRTHSRTAVDAVIGSSARMRPATGRTAATGSRAKRMIRRPMVAFQKPITYQGSVTANSTTRMRPVAPIPPGESATRASQISPAIDSPTHRKNSTGRHADRTVGAAMMTASRGGRSSMKRLCGSLRAFEDIAACRQVQCGESPTRASLYRIVEHQRAGTSSAGYGTTRANMQSKALWYVGPGRAELREETIAAPKPGEVQVRSLFGALSRGTERLIHAGRVPASEYDRMRGPLMAGTFPFPVKYGYATVGRVEAGGGAERLRSRVPRERHGRRVGHCASPCGRGGDHRRTELVWKRRGRGAAWRGVS